MEKNSLSIDIFNHDEEGLSRAVNLLVPSEVWDNGQLNAKK